MTGEGSLCSGLALFRDGGSATDGGLGLVNECGRSELSHDGDEGEGQSHFDRRTDIRGEQVVLRGRCRRTLKKSLYKIERQRGYTGDGVIEKSGKGGKSLHIRGWVTNLL